MKKTLFIFFAFAFIACNNNASNKNKTANEDEATANSASAKTGGGACSKLIFFKKGAAIESITYDGSGSELSKGTTFIGDITNEGGNTVADAEVKTESKTTGSSDFTVKYKCDGENIYVDMGSFLSGIAEKKGAKTDISSIAFPINLSNGQTLADASYSITMSKGGRDIEIKSTIKNRKVEETEKITTPAGTWNCYKVSSIVEAEMNMGDDERMKKIMEQVKKTQGQSRMIMWFAPDFGVVQTEMYMGEQLKHRTIITAVKN